MRHRISRAWHSWKATKSAALVAIAALGISIGCATTIFSLIHAVLLKPLPYSHPDRWVAFFGGSSSSQQAGSYSGLSYADLEDYREQTRSFDVFGWYTVVGDFNLTSPGAPQHLDGVEITPSLIIGVGIRPVLGRVFGENDGANVALISQRLWKRMGGNPGMIGDAITLNGERYTVTGVLPNSFQLPIVNVSDQNIANDVWIPLRRPTDASAQRNFAIYASYARLAPGISISAAQDEARRVAREIVSRNPGRDPHYTVQLFELRTFITKESRPFLLLFLIAAGVLLMVSCANVAGLLIARSVARAPDTAVRVALGASKRHLTKLFVLDALLLSVPAAAMGLVASIGLTRLVLQFAAEYIPRADEVSTNIPVAMFAAALGVGTGVLSSLGPLWQALRTQPGEVLGNAVRSSAGNTTRKLWRLLVSAEMGLSFLLLCMMWLLLSELKSLRHTWPGFNPEHVLTFQINASGIHLPDSKAYLSYQRELLDALLALPGVSSAAFANQIPLQGCCLYTNIVPIANSNDQLPQPISSVIVAPGYFKTLEIPLKLGRLLDDRDDGENPVHVVINEAAARRYWPGVDPTTTGGYFGAVGQTRFQIVGVVPNVRNESLAAESRPEMYILNSLAPVRQMHFIVRSARRPATLISDVEGALHRVAPDQPIYAVQPLAAVVSDSIAAQQFDSLVVSFFAAAASLLAVLGIYSLMSYWVREKRVEIGTRMALGAQRKDLFRILSTEGIKIATYGVAAGLVAAVALTATLTRLLTLHHVSLAAYPGAAFALGGLAFCGFLIPAWRATMLSPMVAIRNESEPLWRGGRPHAAIAQPTEKAGESESPSLLSEFLEPLREARSFTEAISMSLPRLRQRLGSESVILLHREGSSSSEFQVCASSPQLSCGMTISSNGFLTHRLKFLSSALGFGADELASVLAWAMTERPQYTAELEQLRRMGVRLAAAVRMNNEMTGILLAGAAEQNGSFSRAQKRLFHLCAQEIALLLENGRLSARVLEQEKLRRDVALAVEVQERLLPQASLKAGEICGAAFMLPARSVGGDYYDFIQLRDGSIGVVVADVAGKGIAAALLMAVVQTCMRVLSASGIGPAELAARTSEFLFQSTGSNTYATLFYAQIRPDSMEVRYVNAGHNPPLLIRSGDGKPYIEPLTRGGPIIGMFPATCYEEGWLKLESGDLLLAFTDGVTEALNAEEQEFGQDRLEQIACTGLQQPADLIVSSIAQQLRSWTAGASQNDDFTIVAVKANF